MEEWLDNVFPDWSWCGILGHIFWRVLLFSSFYTFDDGVTFHLLSWISQRQQHQERNQESWHAGYIVGPSPSLSSHNRISRMTLSLNSICVVTQRSHNSISTIEFNNEDSLGRGYPTMGCICLRRKTDRNRSRCPSWPVPRRLRAWTTRNVETAIEPFNINFIQFTLGKTDKTKPADTGLHAASL